MIVDKNGNPIKVSKPNKEPQTSAYASLHREIAEHPSRWLTPQKLANYFQNAENGDLIAQNDLALDMLEKDAHIYAEIAKRKRSILNFTWHIKTTGDKVRDQKKAQLIQEFVQNIDDFEDVLLDLMDGILSGYSCLEIADETGGTGWEFIDNTWLVKSLQFRPQSWFCTNPEHQNQLRLRDNSLHGQELWSLGWITHIHRAKSGYISRAGLVRVLAWPYIFKNYAIRDLAEFLEVYGVPVRLGKYSINASDYEKETLLKAVVEMGHNSAGIIPESMGIEFLSAAAGSPEAFQTMIDWAEKSISKAILGGTLTSQADGKTSTNALGTIHEGARFEIAISDARQVASTLTKQLIRPLCVLNGLDPKLFSFEFDTSITDIDEIQKLSQIGLRIPASYIRDKLNIPKPIEDEEVLGETKQPEPIPEPTPDEDSENPNNEQNPKDTQDDQDNQDDNQEDKKDESTKELKDEKLKSTLHAHDDDEFDALSDELSSDWKKQMSPIITPLLEKCQQCQSYDEFLKIITSPDIFQDMDSTKFEDDMGNALFLTYLYGRVTNNA